MPQDLSLAPELTDEADKVTVTLKRSFHYKLTPQYQSGVHSVQSLSNSHLRPNLVTQYSQDGSHIREITNRKISY